MLKCLKFAQICPKHTLKYTIFVNIIKRPQNGQMAKHFISGKQFQKRPKGNPALESEKEVEHCNKKVGHI
jgi:hypothetical protein